MTPEVDAMLLVCTDKLQTQIAPAIPPGYAQGGASTIAMVMILAAQEYGKGADTRIWENARMAEILSANGMTPAAVAASATIVDLNIANAALKRQMIALHEKVEENDDAAARAVEREILAFLRDAADRRRLHLPVL